MASSIGWGAEDVNRADRILLLAGRKARYNRVRHTPAWTGKERTMDQHVLEVFERQQANRWQVARTPAEARLAKLRRLRDAILDQRDALHRAVQDDFGKHPQETDLTEVFPVIAELNHTLGHLKGWMAPDCAHTPLALFGTRSQVRYEPRGLVLVLSPWNYPFQLAINPVIACIAAGNCAVLKPSSKVPATSRFLADLLGSLFDPAEVAVIEGSHHVADDLLELPFDHFFFTGSPAIGKKVMAAAAKHLATVTLELGGKSPAIVDESADVRAAAERILWGKFINAGQTCVAPDYLMLPEGMQDRFLEESRRVLEQRYGRTEEERAACPSFARLVSTGHLLGLRKVLDATVAAGAKIEIGGVSDAEKRYLSPTIVSGVTADMPIMQEEIFGPILPILTYRSLDDAIALVQSRPKPLALYVFSRDAARTEHVLASTTAGGTCVNATVVHLANADLPFGGVGMSGMGSYHGIYGFKALSHERAVLTQGMPDLLRMFYPPYTPLIRELVDVFVKHLA
jgi:aldehyde dehydrogenase (NAD+)